jgi:hypothetical protein
MLEGLFGLKTGVREAGDNYIMRNLIICTFSTYSLSLFPVVPTLEHTASVKRFVSLQFLNSKTVGRSPWTGDQRNTRLLHTQDNINRINADKHSCLAWDSNPQSQRSSERRQ